MNSNLQKVLLEKDIEDIVVIALQNDDKKAIKQLYKDKLINFYETYEDDNNFFHFAAICNAPESFEYAIKHSKAWSNINKHGRTALDYANVTARDAQTQEEQEKAEKIVKLIKKAQEREDFCEALFNIF